MTGAAGAAVDVAVWLIELPSHVSKNRHARWWNGHDYSTDANQAVRLSRREDAEKLIVLGVNGIDHLRSIATEHLWMGAAEGMDMTRVPEVPAEAGAPLDVDSLTNAELLEIAGRAPTNDGRRGYWINRTADTLKRIAASRGLSGGGTERTLREALQRTLEAVKRANLLLNTLVSREGVGADAAARIPHAQIILSGALTDLRTRAALADRMSPPEGEPR